MIVQEMYNHVLEVDPSVPFQSRQDSFRSFRSYIRASKYTFFNLGKQENKYTNTGNHLLPLEKPLQTVSPSQSIISDNSRTFLESTKVSRKLTFVQLSESSESKYRFLVLLITQFHSKVCIVCSVKEILYSYRCFFPTSPQT